MGWKTIKGRPYYYRSKREGGRVVSEYWGTGAPGIVRCVLDDADRDEREEIRAWRKSAEDEDRRVRDWFERIEAVASAAMVAAGFHRHHRGDWRRHRMAENSKALKTTAAPSWSDGAAVEALLRRGHKGDKACVPQLRALFADAARHPGTLDAYGSPAEWLKDDILGKVAGENLAVREAASAKLAEVRRDLEGPDPSPMERLLAERAAFCWFLVNRYESYYATAKDSSLRQADYQQRRIDRAHARFLSALKTLATVRKLALPALQVNIGENQVNNLGSY